MVHYERLTHPRFSAIIRYAVVVKLDIFGVLAIDFPEVCHNSSKRLSLSHEYYKATHLRQITPILSALMRLFIWTSDRQKVTFVWFG